MNVHATRLTADMFVGVSRQADKNSDSWKHIYNHRCFRRIGRSATDRRGEIGRVRRASCRHSSRDDPRLECQALCLGWWTHPVVDALFHELLRVGARLSSQHGISAPDAPVGPQVHVDREHTVAIPIDIGDDVPQSAWWFIGARRETRFVPHLALARELTGQGALPIPTGVEPVLQIPGKHTNLLELAHARHDRRQSPC